MFWGCLYSEKVVFPLSIMKERFMYCVLFYVGHCSLLGLGMCCSRLFSIQRFHWEFSYYNDGFTNICELWGFFSLITFSTLCYVCLVFQLWYAIGNFFFGLVYLVFCVFLVFVCVCLFVVWGRFLCWRAGLCC